MSTSNPKGVKCAHCKGYHPTVAAVKLCARDHNAERAAAVQHAESKTSGIAPDVDV
jgi:hypothetical protein